MLHPTHRVLQEHNSIVHQEADGQGERHQREVVQAVLEHAHRHNSEQERQRQCHGRDQRVRGASQKHEDHAHDQDEGDDERHLHIFDRVDDGARVVIDRRNAHRPGQLRIDERQQGTDILRHLYGVGSGLAIDGHHHGGRWLRVASHPKTLIDPLVLDRVVHLGHVAEVDRGTVLAADDEIAIGLGTFQLPPGAEERRARRPVELARPDVARTIGDRRGHVIDGETARPQRGRVDFDTDR